MSFLYLISFLFILSNDEPQNYLIDSFCIDQKNIELDIRFDKKNDLYIFKITNKGIEDFKTSYFCTLKRVKWVSHFFIAALSIAIDYSYLLLFYNFR